jgi:hypothetical protein
MQRVKVTGRRARFGPGFVLKLTDEQLASRAHCLDAVKGGHAVREPIEFKFGEEVEVVAGTFSKVDLEDVTPAAEPAPEKSAKAGGKKAAQPDEPPTNGQSGPTEPAPEKAEETA